LVAAARPTPAAAAPPLRPPSLAGSRWWRRTSSPARCAKGRGAKQGQPAGRGGGGADGGPRRGPARRRVTPAGGERVLPRVPAASGGPRAVSALLQIFFLFIFFPILLRYVSVTYQWRIRIGYVPLADTQRRPSLIKTPLASPRDLAGIAEDRR